MNGRAHVLKFDPDPELAKKGIDYAEQYENWLNNETPPGDIVAGGVYPYNARQLWVVIVNKEVR